MLYQGQAQRWQTRWKNGLQARCQVGWSSWCGLCCAVVVILLLTQFARGVTPEALQKGDKYYVVIDGGSSGSRVFVYRINNSSSDPTQLVMLQTVAPQKKTEPGLSSFAVQPSLAFLSLEPLLEHAGHYLPTKLAEPAPVYVLATGGMRRLSREVQDSILGAVRTGFSSLPNDRFEHRAEYVRILTGQEEGVYSWLSMNYALGRLGKNLNTDVDDVGPASSVGANSVGSTGIAGGISETDHDAADDPPSVRGKEDISSAAIIEIGGSSAQLAMEVSPRVQLPPSLSYSFSLHLSCTPKPSEEWGVQDSSSSRSSIKLLVDSFPYGANAARKRYSSHLELTQKNTDPCMLEGQTDTMGSRQVQGTGSFDMCRQAIVSALLTSSVETSSAAFDSYLDEIYQIRPFVMEGKYQDWFGFGEVYYSSYDLLGLPAEYDADAFNAASADYCSTPWSIVWSKYTMGEFEGRATAQRVREQCFKSAFVSAFLHHSLGFPSSDSPPSHLIATNSGAEDHPVHWSLGALLHLISGHSIECDEHSKLPTTPSRSSTGLWALAFLALLLSGVVIARWSQAENSTTKSNQWRMLNHQRP